MSFYVLHFKPETRKINTNVALNKNTPRFFLSENEHIPFILNF